MSLDADEFRQVTETSAALLGLGALGAMCYRAARWWRERTCSGMRWAKDWAAVPGRVAGLAESTERRFEAVESELAMHGTHISMALDKDGIAHWRTDAAGNLILASPGYLRLFNTTEAECYGRGWISLVHPDDYDLGVEGFFLCVGDRRTWTMQCRMRSEHGYILCDHYARPVMAGARCVGYVGASKQITGPTS